MGSICIIQRKSHPIVLNMPVFQCWQLQILNSMYPSWSMLNANLFTGINIYVTASELLFMFAAWSIIWPNATMIKQCRITSQCQSNKTTWYFDTKTTRLRFFDLALTKFTAPHLKLILYTITGYHVITNYTHTATQKYWQPPQL